jgi:hypothetical protein
MSEGVRDFGEPQRINAEMTVVPIRPPFLSIIH